MNTLDDLRAALEREASFDDAERHARPAAVRQRVRTVRRRRAGTVAMAAAVMLVAATAGVGVLRSPSSPEPAETLEDVHVPQRIDVYGFPYKLTSTHRVAGDGTVVLDPTPEGPTAVRLVSTGLGSGEATLWSGYYPVARVRDGEQVSPATTGVGANGLRVEFVDTPDVARAEVAVYEPTGELAPGISTNGAVFRQRYAGHELVAASFGEAGDEARVDVPAGIDDLSTSAYCHSTSPGLWLHGLGAGDALPCAELDTGNDPGPTNANFPNRPRPGDDVVGVYVTKGENGPRAADSDVTFGVALYRETVPPISVLGVPVETVLDQHGRTWRLADTLPWTADDEIEVDTSTGDALIAAAYVGAVDGYLSWRGAPDGGWIGFDGSDSSDPESPGAMYAGVLLAGDHTVQLHLEGPDPQGRLLVYRPE